MRKTRKQGNPNRPKAKLGLPDLDHSRSAVLESLRSPESKRGYRHALDEFIEWYCSEPRLSFNKTVVTRYRIHLENRHLAAGTVNGRLAAVRRLAYEAADSGLLSPELAAGIRRVKGVKKLGVRLGNWLTAEEGRRLLQAPDPETLKGKRDRAILAVLLGCGLRRRELADLNFRHLHRTELTLVLTAASLDVRAFEHTLHAQTLRHIGPQSSLYLRQNSDCAWRLTGVSGLPVIPTRGHRIACGW